MKKNIRILALTAWGIAVLSWVAFEPLVRGQAPPAFAAGTESGFATFQTQCAQCHGNPNVAGRASRDDPGKNL
jgi:mono/diheme cytochrome c family protein